jgi:hypothetical protein
MWRRWRKREVWCSNVTLALARVHDPSGQRRRLSATLLYSQVLFKLRYGRSAMVLYHDFVVLMRARHVFQVAAETS